MFLPVCHSRCVLRLTPQHVARRAASPATASQATLALHHSLGHKQTYTPAARKAASCVQETGACWEVWPHRMALPPTMVTAAGGSAIPTLAFAAQHLPCRVGQSAARSHSFALGPTTTFAAKLARSRAAARSEHCARTSCCAVACSALSLPTCTCHAFASRQHACQYAQPWLLDTVAEHRRTVAHCASCTVQEQPVCGCLMWQGEHDETGWCCSGLCTPAGSPDAHSFTYCLLSAGVALSARCAMLPPARAQHPPECKHTEQTT